MSPYNGPSFPVPDREYLLEKNAILREALDRIIDECGQVLCDTDGREGNCAICTVYRIARDALLRAGKGEKDVWDRVADWERKNGIPVNVTINDETGNKLWPAPKPEVMSCETCHHAGKTEDPNDGENGYACAWLDETKAANCRRTGHTGWTPAASGEAP